MSAKQGRGGLRTLWSTVLGAAAAATVPSYPELDVEETVRVGADMQAFLTDQIFAMPKFLLVPFLIALTGFEWHTAPLRGARFSRLRLADRQDVMGRWSRSRIPAKRDLVKLIRSCALFYYLDHPMVCAQLDAKAAHDAH